MLEVYCIMISGDSIAFLRSLPQFQLMRRMVQQEPSRLPQILQEMGQSNPSLLQMISRNQEEFMHMLNEHVEQTGGEGGPTGGMDGPQHIQVTQQEKEAIDRLKQLGFSEAECLQAYFACEKNENLAANYLLSNQGNDEDS